MRLVQASASGSPPPRPFGAQFIPTPRRSEIVSELRGRGYVIASVLRAPAPGRLRQAVEEAVESSLALRGALPPNVSIEADTGASLRDQLARVRSLGAAGIALVLAPLTDTTSEPGQLGPADSSVLAVWSDAAQMGPAVLVLDENDRGLRILAPVRLEELLAESTPTRRHAEGARPLVRAVPPPPPPEPESAEVARALAEPPAPASPEPEASGERPVHGRLRPRSQLRKDSSPPGSPSPLPPAPSTMLEGERPRGSITRPTPPPGMPSPLPPAPPAPSEGEMARPRALAGKSAPPPPPEPSARAKALQDEPAEAPPVADTLPPPPPVPQDLVPTPVLGQPPVLSAVERILSAAEWRAFAMDLDHARGPKPAGVIDKLFATRYMPLLAALARGHADAAIKGIVDGFRTSFEHSYIEGFSAIRATGKRPLMVLDAPEVAGRIGRQNSARAVRLLMIDAMRFDLGERVMSRLKPRLSGRAVCVDRTLLWSALPTTTPAQVQLLGRGAEGLREPLPEPGPELDIVRGRALSTIRRERYGGKEVFKLDLCEARLRGVGPGFDERLNGIADEAAQVVAKFVETLPPRTLLFVFGDHGFRLPCDARGTGQATQGGASPEEVLVPGYAWLMGGVH